MNQNLSPRNLKEISAVLMEIAPNYKDLEVRIELAKIGIACKDSFELFNISLKKIDNSDLAKANQAAIGKYNEDKSEKSMDKYLSDLKKINDEFSNVIEEIVIAETESNSMFNKRIDFNDIPSIQMKHIQTGITEGFISQIQLESLIPIVE